MTESPPFQTGSIPRIGPVFNVPDVIAQAYIELAEDELVAVGCVEDGTWATVRLYSFDDIENHRYSARWDISDIIRTMILSEPAIFIGAT